MQNKSNQRIAYLDILRVVATFAVILLHVASVDFRSFSLSWDWYISTIGDSITRWCVPVFVMISGALFLDPNKEITYKEVLKKRVPRLLLAYVFWTVLYVLYGFLLDDFEGFTLKQLVRRSFVSPHFHLWFLPMLMGVYLLIPILRRIAQDNKLLRYALIIWIVFDFISFFQYVAGGDFKAIKHFYSLFTMNSIVGFSGYYLLGYFLSKHEFAKRQRIWIYLIGMIGALVVINGSIQLSVSMGEAKERYFANMSLQVVSMATAIFVLVKELAFKCGIRRMKFIDFVRKDLFGVYLTHALWLPVVNTETIRHCCSEIVTLPLITIIVFVLSLFTTKLIRLVPVLRKVVE